MGVLGLRAYQIKLGVAVKMSLKVGITLLKSVKD